MRAGARRSAARTSSEEPRWVLFEYEDSQAFGEMRRGMRLRVPGRYLEPLGKPVETPPAQP